MPFNPNKPNDPAAAPTPSTPNDPPRPGVPGGKKLGIDAEKARASGQQQIDPGNPNKPKQPEAITGALAGQMQERDATPASNGTDSAAYDQSMGDENPALSESQKMFQGMIDSQSADFGEQRNELRQDRAYEKNRMGNVAGRMGGGLGAGFTAGQRQADIGSEKNMSAMMLDQGDRQRQLQLSMLDNNINEANKIEGREYAEGQQDKQHQQRLDDQFNSDFMDMISNPDVTDDQIALFLEGAQASGQELNPEMASMLDNLGLGGKNQSMWEGLSEEEIAEKLRKYPDQQASYDAWKSGSDGKPSDSGQGQQSSWQADTTDAADKRNKMKNTYTNTFSSKDHKKLENMSENFGINFDGSATNAVENYEKIIADWGKYGTEYMQDGISLKQIQLYLSRAKTSAKAAAYDEK